MSFERSCASCRHWMCGTLSQQYRINAYIAGWMHVCHVQQPTKTNGCDPECRCYERAVMTE